MDDRKVPPSLPDDQNCLATLSEFERDLARGVAVGGERALERSPRPGGAGSPRRAIAEPSPGAVAPTGPPGALPRRRLLDLFPPLSIEREPPAIPPRGTARAPERARASPRRAERAAPGPVEKPAYETFYGLRESPFSLTSDLRFLYHSIAHDRVADELVGAIARREGVIVVSGDRGTGKTMLCRAIVAQLDRRTLASCVAEPLASFDDLVRRALVDFGVVSPEDLARASETSGADLTKTLRSFLASLAPLQAGAVLILDEAQHLPPEALRQLPELLDLSHERLQIVLAGEPSLASRLRRADLQPLKRRIATELEVGRLAPDEVPGYVMHRLSVAGDSPRIDFDDRALLRVFTLSEGIPRTVNVLCDRALARGFDRSASVIDLELIQAAAGELGVAPPSRDARHVVRVLLGVCLLVALMCAGAASAAWVFRDRLGRTLAWWEAMPAAPPAPALPAPRPLTRVAPP